ncbi:MAG: acyl--CoA ligase [Acidobacteria bacterium]|nr:acyl--CoA ligase [Acidobacteriota bacterium]
MRLHELIAQSADREPSAPALIEGARHTTYGELDRESNRFAHLLRDAGITAGDRVVIALDNSREMVAAYFGAMKAGAVAVPLPPGPKSDRLLPAIADASPRVAVIDGDTASAPALAEALRHVELVLVAGDAPAAASAFQHLSSRLATCSDTRLLTPGSADDLAAIIYTSGSTGAPRGVMLSHGNFVANARAIVEYLHLTAADRVMCVLPFHYVYGLSLLHTHMLVGGAVVIENRAAFPNVVLNGMRAHRVTGFAGVPSTFALMLHRSSLDDIDLPDLRYVTQAGGGMPPARIGDWLSRGPKAAFYVMYGATEAAARLTYLPPADLERKLGSIGRAISGVEILIVDEAGARVPRGATGELVARGPNIARGYWHDDDETARRFDALGYHTGDLGYEDDEGFLFLVGRRHDMIKVGANRVGAREIEDVLHEHPGVVEAAVVAAPHELLGEAPVAFVTARSTGSTVSAVELRAHCASRLPAYKVPVLVTIVTTDLPKLPGSGKVDRQALRTRAAEMSLETVARPS